MTEQDNKRIALCEILGWRIKYSDYHSQGCVQLFDPTGKPLPEWPVLQRDEAWLGYLPQLDMNLISQVLKCLHPDQRDKYVKQLSLLVGNGNSMPGTYVGIFDMLNASAELHATALLFPSPPPTV